MLHVATEPLTGQCRLHVTERRRTCEWILNMAELVWSMLQTQCLNRRIPDASTLRSEVAAWERARNEQNVTVDWQFTTEDARTQLHRLYPSIEEVGN